MQVKGAAAGRTTFELTTWKTLSVKRTMSRCSDGTRKQEAFGYGAVVGE